MSQGVGRVAFLYNRDYSGEYADYLLGKVPAHRLFGAAHVTEFGAVPTHYRWPSRWPKGARALRVWRMLQAVMVGFDQRGLTAVVCTTEASALPVLLLRRTGLLRRPVVVLSVAVLRPAYATGPRRHVIGWLLRGAALVSTYSSSQIRPMVESFGLDNRRVRFIPLGVDTDFFALLKTSPGAGPQVLSVGTNEGKDMLTLMASLPERTDCVVITDAGNILMAQAHPNSGGVDFRQDVPITELRCLYGTARHIVIPLQESATSSGQTVLLENLVSGRSVIVSRVSGIADYLHGTAAVTFEAGDSDQLRQLLSGPATVPTPEQIALARNEFNSRKFTQRLLDSISSHLR